MPSFLAGVGQLSQLAKLCFKPNLYSLEMCGLIDSTAYSVYQFDVDTYLLNESIKVPNL